MTARVASQYTPKYALPAAYRSKPGQKFITLSRRQHKYQNKFCLFPNEKFHATILMESFESQVDGTLEFAGEYQPC